MSSGYSTGLEVVDLATSNGLRHRPLRRRGAQQQFDALWTTSLSFIERPESLAQDLADAAMGICGADSAGISSEQPHRSDEEYFLWIAASGRMRAMLDATLPRWPSACGICLERGSPQSFKVRQSFFDMVHLKAPEVTDGLMVPWSTGGQRSVLFVAAHGRWQAFDQRDLEMLTILAKFATAAEKRRRHREQAYTDALTAAVMAMTEEIVTQIDDLLLAVKTEVDTEAYGGEAEALAYHLKHRLRVLTELAQCGVRDAETAVREMLEWNRENMGIVAPATPLLGDGS